MHTYAPIAKLQSKPMPVPCNSNDQTSTGSANACKASCTQLNTASCSRNEMLRAARHAYRYTMHFLKRGQEPGSVDTHTQPAPTQPASQHTLMCNSSSCCLKGASGSASAACCHQITPILGPMPHGTPGGRAATQASHLRHHRISTLQLATIRGTAPASDLPSQRSSCGSYCASLPGQP